MLDAAREVDKHVFPVEGGVGSGYVANAIANSNGISGYDRGTIVECSIAALGKSRRRSYTHMLRIQRSTKLQPRPDMGRQRSSQTRSNRTETQTGRNQNNQSHPYPVCTTRPLRIHTYGRS